MKPAFTLGNDGLQTNQKNINFFTYLICLIEKISCLQLGHFDF
jgi:hypothetical protein